MVNAAGVDLPQIWIEPYRWVDGLNRAASYQQVLDELPDIEIATL